MFKLFYLITLTTIFIVATPLLFLLSFKQKYRNSIKKRFFPLFNSPFKDEKIWFHVCSFGETKAIKPLLDALEEDVNISVVTQTGFNEANKYSDSVRFLPFEIFLPFWVKKQKLLIVLEAELWYMLFLTAKAKNTPTILLNARISDNSYKGYRKFKFLYKKIFENIDYIYAQSETDKERLEELGGKNIEVLGNIKLFADIKIENRYKKQDTFITTAASTHDGEEKLIFNSWIESRKGKLIVVPRHPERFNSIDKFLESNCKEHSLSYNRLSNNKSFASDVTLVDAMGELNEIYAISDLVILGGAFFPNIGGHNFVEPAFFGCKVVTGEHFFNQKAIFPFIKNIEIAKDKDDLNRLIRDGDLIKNTIIVNSPDIKEVKGRVLSALPPTLKTPVEV